MCGRDFAVPTTYFAKLNISAILLWEMTIVHWEWREGESSVYPPYGSEMDGSI
jgi:hypothetical protein